VNSERTKAIRARLAAAQGPTTIKADVTTSVVYRASDGYPSVAIGDPLMSVDDLADLLDERDRLLADNAQLRTLLPTAKCDCGHSRSRHKDCDDRDECVECICSELRFGETE
jgi:hypothetical protein